MQDTLELIRQHYEQDQDSASLVSKITQILDALKDGPVNPSQLAGLDQFHVRGLSATKELAKVAGIQRGATILDAGSGLGGPSRCLAYAYDCSVVGVDLAPSFVAVSQLLAEKTGLSALVSYQVGDLSDLPFPDRRFDLVWTQHAVMNIHDRERLYREFRRVLKPGGKLAFYDVLAANGKPELLFPVPWAQNSGTSFLLTETETIAVHERVGFTISAWNGVTMEALTWIGQQKPPLPQALSLVTVMGTRFADMAANLVANIRKGRVRLVMGVCKLDSDTS